MIVSMVLVKKYTLIEKVDLQTDYLESISLSLIEFAEKNTDFSKYLFSLLTLTRESIFQVFDYNPPSNPSKLIALEDYSSAVRRADWLFVEIKERRIFPNTLASWYISKEKEFPKAIVIGIKIGIIPGLTLGNIRRRKSINIIFDSNFKTKDKIEFAKKSSKAVLSLFESNLNDAEGNLKRLEPEISDWFFGEKEIDFYKADTASFEKICKELEQDNIPHVVQRENGNILAISPAVNISNISIPLLALE